MRGALVELEDLQAITGYDRSADIERCLKSQGIRVFYGRNGQLFTTLGLIEAAGGLTPANGPAQPAPYSPDLVA